MTGQRSSDDFTARMAGGVFTDLLVHLTVGHLPCPTFRAHVTTNESNRLQSRDTLV
jgi:hypothetical protein